MKHVKIPLLALALVLLAGTLSACGGTSTDKGEVNVYNWGEYIDEDLIKQFEEETGITVNYTNYDSNESMYAKLQQGGVNYDVVIPSDYMISRMIEEDMLATLNYDNIPNYENILAEYKNAGYDPDNEYTVPYAGGVVGIIYNSTMVDEPVDSWSIMFDEKYSGQILMIDNSRDAFGIALKYLGYSQNTTDETELQEAYELLQRQKPLRQGWVMDTIFDKMEAGEAAIGTYYAGDYLSMLENNPDLRFVVPKEGSNKFMDCMCVLKDAKNKENAETFINFMCGVDVATQNAEYIGYTCPVAGVRENLELDEEAEAISYPDQSVLDICEYFVNLPQDTLKLYTDLWIKLKS